MTKKNTNKYSIRGPKISELILYPLRIRIFTSSPNTEDQWTLAKLEYETSKRNEI